MISIGPARGGKYGKFSCRGIFQKWISYLWRLSHSEWPTNYIYWNIKRMMTFPIRLELLYKIFGIRILHIKMEMTKTMIGLSWNWIPLWISMKMSNQHVYHHPIGPQIQIPMPVALSVVSSVWIWFHDLKKM